MKDFRPMLAGTPKDLGAITWPKIATPKYDGIRAITYQGQIVSRRLKPIPNRFIRETLQGLPDGLDGELMIEGTFSDVTSGIMSKDGEPPFVYHVFDWLGEDLTEPYINRIDRLEQWCAAEGNPFVRYVPAELLESREDLDAFESQCLLGGFEGVMVRDPWGPYKFGRSTEKEGYLLKVKRWTTEEAIVVGFEELQHNDNPAEMNELGLTKRPTAKAGKRPGGTLGTLVVEARRIRFEIGSGFTEAQRQEIWDHQDKYLHELVTFKHQAHGAKDKPRFPGFVGFRHVDDLVEREPGSDG
jgi:DNA ligase-1